jgi:hypothetical protein
MQISFLPWTAWVRMAVWLLLGAVIQTVSADDSSSTNDSTFTITEVDLLCVFGTFAFELSTYFGIRRFIKAHGIRNRHGTDISAPGIKIALACFCLDVFCDFFKLYAPPPPIFDCTTSRCSKVVHNAICTGACCLLDFMYCWMFTSAKDLQDPPTLLHSCGKMCAMVLSFGYLVFDAVKNPAPGPGSTALVVMTCLAVLVVFILQGIVLVNPGYLKSGIHSGNQEMSEPETRNA